MPAIVALRVQPMLDGESGAGSIGGEVTGAIDFTGSVVR